MLFLSEGLRLRDRAEPHLVAREAVLPVVRLRRSRIVGGRDWVRLGAVEMGLDCLRRYLHGLPVQERIDFEKVEASGTAPGDKN